MSSPEKYTETPRLPSHVTFIPHVHGLLFLSQLMSDRAYDLLQFQPQQGTSSDAGRIRFALTVYAKLTLSMD